MHIPVFSTVQQMLLHAWKVFRAPGTPLLVKAGIILAIAYILSPLDLVPDWYPFLGVADDLGLAAAVLYWLKSIKLP